MVMFFACFTCKLTFTVMGLMRSGEAIQTQSLSSCLVEAIARLFFEKLMTFKKLVHATTH